jgi:hypothetical protein
MLAPTDDRARSHMRGSAAARWAIYALVLVLPCSVYWSLGSPAAPDILPIYVTPGIYLSDLAVGAVILASLVADRGWQRLGATVRATAHMSVPLLALAALAFLTAPWARSPALASYTALRWLIAAGLFLGLAQSNVLLAPILTAFLAGLGIQALIGLGQVVRQGPLGLPGELTLDPAREGASIIAVGGSRWLRAYGLTFHPNVLGGFMAVGLLVSLPLLERRSIQLVWWLVWIGLLLSFSRAAWLGAGLALPPLAAWLAWRHPHLRRALRNSVALAAIAMVLVGTLFSGQLLARVGSLAVAEDQSLRERGEMIVLALEIIAARPLTGVGAGNFPLAMQASGTSTLPQFAHNVPILLAAEIGVAAGALWCWLWLAPGRLLDRHARDPSPWPVVLIAAWLALGVIGLWDSYPWALNQGCLLTVTLLGLLSRALAGSNSTEDSDRSINI